MASSIQYGPCTLAENDAAIVIQKFWRGQKTPTYTRISLLALQIQSGKLRKQEGETSLSINVLPLDHLFQKTVKTNLWFKKIVKTLEEWKIIIEAPETKISKEYNENLTTANNIIQELLWKYLILKNGLRLGNKMQFIYDQAEEIQAVALYTIRERNSKPFEIRVEYICTAPHNLIGINSEIRRLLNPKDLPVLRGCGRALIEFFAFECLKNKLKLVSLFAAPSSFEFYKKMGFENDGFFMFMSAKAAFEFVHSKRGGRAKISLLNDPRRI